MDKALISLPENSSLKFLMPSRRHHPQVEPLLATYEIFYTKRWLNHFWSLQETSFIARKCYLLKNLEGLMPLSKIFPTVSILHYGILLISWEETAEKSPFFPFLTWKTNLHFSPLFLHKNPLFFHISPSSIHENHFPCLKLIFELCQNPQNPLKTWKNSKKKSFFLPQT